MRVVLGPGASRNPVQMVPHAAGLRAAGHEVEVLILPGGSAETVARIFRERQGPRVVAGGQSFGGRAASLAAAGGAEFAGLLLFSYPLHPPGRPEQLRTAHWPQIEIPVLLLVGDRDPFCDLRLLERELPRLKDVEVRLYPGAGHGLKGHLEAALADSVAWLAAR